VRLVLWDVDGTLVRAGPVARQAFDLAVEGALGRHPGDHGVQMSGKTDPQIALEILAAAEVAEEEAARHLPVILDGLERELAAAAGLIRSHGQVMPGVEQVLDRLAARPDVVQSVLTGNIAANAAVKLGAFGLERWLQLDIGAFGSDHPDRRELVPVALAKARGRGYEVAAAETWVVGDTPRDRARRPHLQLVHRRGHDGLRPDQAGLPRQRELEVAEAAALPEAGAVLADGDTAGDDEVDGLQVVEADGTAGGGGALDRRRGAGSGGEVVGVEQEERALVREAGHGHEHRLAVLQRPLAHRPLGRVGVGLDRAGRGPLRRGPQPLGRGLRPGEVRDAALGAGEPGGPGGPHRRPHLVAQRGLRREQGGVAAGVAVVAGRHAGTLRIE
jgi:phosphoglycolate phosphatase